MIKRTKLAIITIISTSLLQNTLALTCKDPSGPCDQPVCCHLKNKTISKDERNYNIHPKGHLIELVHGACKGVCPEKCPKQLGESCGGLWNMAGSCDTQWLRCKGSTRNDPGKCVRKTDIGNKKAKKMKNVAPVCEDVKKEKVCKCKLSKSFEKTIKDLPEYNKWCFLEKIESHEDPKKNCYNDVTWSSTNGQFWSYQAYQAENPSSKY